MSTTPIPSGTTVRYIKLGEQGGWEEECLRESTIRIGFGSANPERLVLCQKEQWKELAESFRKERKDKGTATRSANELKLFFIDDGSTLWITFMGGRLYWGRVDSTRPVPHQDGHGVFRRIAGGWRSKDVKNHEELTADRLSGALTKLAGYRGTSCRVDKDITEDVIHRINGEKTPLAAKATTAWEELTTCARNLMKRLSPGDFETLVDLIFSGSGWRRLGPVGKTQKTLDIELELPSTRERAFVQVKTKTTPAEFTEYVRRFETDNAYARMFYVFHSGNVGPYEHSRITVIGPGELADLVMDAGLANWVIRKAL
jgi:hypothetical protein